MAATGPGTKLQVRQSIGWCLALLAAVCLLPAKPHAANALAGNASPYLAMHGRDPVQWREWGPEAFAEAREQGRLLFVSSGYFACHWCHVMQRESYRNPRIAELINGSFVPVKLDRELHPAVDTYLIDFVQRTAGQAGWPLNVFLSPEGYPLIGLTYAPPDQFEALLKRVKDAWAKESGELGELARQAAQEQTAADEPPASTPDSAPSPADLAERLKQQALLFGDDLAGGFGRQTRFPMAPNLSALLELQARSPDEGLAAFLGLTLDAMMSGGLRDHLGGGFFRYTVDPDWLTPHFEKMLYTQALLVPLYLRAAAVLERPAYREVARDTLDFLLRGMQGVDGAYIASLSAVDDAGVEGGYYLWRLEELEQLLAPDERGLLVLAWGLEGPTQLEAGLLPTLKRSLQEAAAELGVTPEEAGRLMDSARKKLLAARARRTLPRDGKQLAAWNGLALSALALGVKAFDDDAYRSGAGRLRDFLVQSLWDGEHLHRARSPQGWIGEATVEDYAYVAKGLRDWARINGSAGDEDLKLSRRLVQLAWERFHDGHGWRLSAEPLLPAVPSEPAFSDSPLPSPAALIIAQTLEDGDAVLSARAQQALQSSLPLISRRPFAFATQTLLTVEHPTVP